MPQTKSHRTVGQLNNIIESPYPMDYMLEPDAWMGRPFRHVTSSGVHAGPVQRAPKEFRSGERKPEKRPRTDVGDLISQFSGADSLVGGTGRDRMAKGRSKKSRSRDTLRAKVNYAVQKFQKELGLTRKQAVGVLGSMAGESGLGLDTKAWNPDDPGGSYGIGQWNDGGDGRKGGRKTNLGRFAKKDKQKRSVDDFTLQIDYTIHEAKTTHKAAWKAVQKARTSKQAARSWTNLYERPSVPRHEARTRNARYYESLLDAETVEPYDNVSVSGADVASAAEAELSGMQNVPTPQSRPADAVQEAAYAPQDDSTVSYGDITSATGSRSGLVETTNQNERNQAFRDAMLSRREARQDDSFFGNISGSLASLTSPDTSDAGRFEYAAPDSVRDVERPAEWATGSMASLGTSPAEAIWDNPNGVVKQSTALKGPAETKTTAKTGRLAGSANVPTARMADEMPSSVTVDVSAVDPSRFGAPARQNTGYQGDLTDVGVYGGLIDPQQYAGVYGTIGQPIDEPETQTAAATVDDEEEDTKRGAEIADELGLDEDSIADDEDDLSYAAEEDDSTDGDVDLDSDDEESVAVAEPQESENFFDRVDKGLNKAAQNLGLVDDEEDTGKEKDDSFFGDTSGLAIVGGIAGGLIGGTPGAFIGGLIGQAVDRTLLSEDDETVDDESGILGGLNRAMDEIGVGISDLFGGSGEGDTGRRSRSRSDGSTFGVGGFRGGRNSYAGGGGRLSGSGPGGGLPGGPNPDYQGSHGEGPGYGGNRSQK